MAAGTSHQGGWAPKVGGGTRQHRVEKADAAATAVLAGEGVGPTLAPRTMQCRGAAAAAVGAQRVGWLRRWGTGGGEGARWDGWIGRPGGHIARAGALRASGPHGKPTSLERAKNLAPRVWNFGSFRPQLNFAAQ